MVEQMPWRDLAIVLALGVITSFTLIRWSGQFHARVWWAQDEDNGRRVGWWYWVGGLVATLIMGVIARTQF